MKHLIGLLLMNLMSIIFIVSISAQTETTNWKYQLDVDATNPDQNYLPDQRSSTYLKLLNSDRTEMYDFSLGFSIRKSIENGELNIYKTDGTNQAFSKEEIPYQLYDFRTEAIVTYDDETYEEHVETIENKTAKFPTVNTVYQFEQNWIFNTSKQELNNPIQEIKILKGFKETEDGFKEIKDDEGLFLIKNKPFEKKINTKKLLKKKRITWAKSIYCYGQFENKELRAALLSKLHLKKNKIVNPIDYKEMNQTEVTELLAGSVDTLLDYKADELEPEISIVREEALTAENVFDFKILQDFYYDEKRKRFLSKIVAIAPAIKKYDEGGNYLYTLPLFWIVYDDGFVGSEF